MLKFYIISTVILFGRRILECNAEGPDQMMLFSYKSNSEGFKHLSDEIENIKSSLEVLKIRSELEQARYEQLLMKLDILINKSERAGSAEKDESDTESATESATAEDKYTPLIIQWFPTQSKELDENDSSEVITSTTPGDVEPEQPKTRFPSNCAEALNDPTISFASGIYSIKVDSYHSEPFEVFCDAATLGGNWTIIQRRLNGVEDFERDWYDYKQGFGDLAADFFIGLEKLHVMTTESPQELLVVLEDFEDEVRYARYDAFAIGDEDENFVLKTLGAYSGNAGDSLRTHESMKFTTTDVDNDLDPTINCAQEYHGGWWYNKCHESNLNGKYLDGVYGFYNDGEGIDWSTWKGHQYSLKSVKMLIRPQTQNIKNEFESNDYFNIY